MSGLIDRYVQRPAPNIEENATRGIGLAVTNLEGELWIQQDQQGRDRTGRRKGDISIIFETEKDGEPTRSNILGAMSELTSDRTLHIVKDHLYTTDGEELQSTPRIFSSNEGRPIDYALAVVIYDGNPNAMHNLEVHDKDETTPVGWMTLQDFLASNGVRPLARDAVSYLEANGTIQQKLEAFGQPKNRRLVLPPDFVVSEYHKRRERSADSAPVLMSPTLNYLVA